MSFVEVKNLFVTFGSKSLVHDVSFSLDRGETLALVGESGAGKTLTALSLLQLLPAELDCSGSVIIDGWQVMGATPVTLSRLRGGIAGIVHQLPMTTLNVLKRVDRDIIDEIDEHQVTRDARTRAEALFQEVGFGRNTRVFPGTLSSGERQRVMIAKALANNPLLLIADEPTATLDSISQMHIFKLLADLKQARKLALLLITHELEVIRRYADRVLVLNEGQVVETGRPDSIFCKPAHPTTERLLRTEVRAQPPPVLQQAAIRTEANDVKVHFPIRRGLLHRVVGYNPGLDGVSVSVRVGETVALVGESGSGKTVFAQAVIGRMHAEGSISQDGTEILACERAARPPVKLGKTIGGTQIIFQDPFGVLEPNLRVGESITRALAEHEPKLSSTDCESRVAEALQEVGLPADIFGRFPHQVSGGQRQLAAIATAIAVKPKLVVLDEPFSSLDLLAQAEIVELLCRLQHDYALSYLFISHSLRAVRALAHRIIVLRRGRVVEQGPADVILSHPREKYTRELIASAL
jgi:microcin C transport system ATP-binding protein